MRMAIATLFLRVANKSRALPASLKPLSNGNPAVGQEVSPTLSVSCVSILLDTPLQLSHQLSVDLVDLQPHVNALRPEQGCEEGPCFEAFL